MKKIGEAPPLSFSGTLQPEGDSLMLRGLFNGAGLSAARIAEAAGLRGVKKGSLALSGKLSADLGTRTCTMESSLSLPDRASADLGELTGGILLGSAHSTAELTLSASGPLDRFPDSWRAKIEAVMDKPEALGLR